MTILMKTRLRGPIAAVLLALPLLILAGCADPPITGPGGGPSSGAAGSTDASGGRMHEYGADVGGGNPSPK